MSETDGLALAWAALACLMLAGVVPTCWPIVAFPVLYVGMRLALAVVGGFLCGMLRGIRISARWTVR